MSLNDHLYLSQVNGVETPDANPDGVGNEIREVATEIFGDIAETTNSVSLKRALTTAILATSLALAPVAHAGPNTQRPEIEIKEDKAAARKAFMEGKKLQKAGKCTEALKFLEESYKKFPHPFTLVSIAQCHEALGDYKKALVNYEKAVKDAKAKGLNLKQVEPHLNKFAKTMKKKGIKLDDLKEKPKDLIKKDPVQPIVKPATQPATKPFLPKNGGKAPEQSNTLRIVGISTLIAGAAAAGVSIYSAIRSSDLAKDYEAAKAGGASNKDLNVIVDDGDAANLQAIIFGVTAGALAATGAGIIIYDELDRRSGESKLKVKLMPTVVLGGGGVGIHGTF